MKKITTYNSSFYLVLFIFSTIFFSCNKSTSDTSSMKLNIEKIKNDTDFKTYLIQLDSLKNHLTSRKSNTILNEADFIKIYTKALKEKDIHSQEIISNLMGYEANTFWQARMNRIKILQKLNSRYDLSKIEMTNFKKENQKRSFMYDLDECLEMYKICKENVTATYAMDQITCVTAGALGFTGIGVVVFVGCEAAAVYRLYQGDRNCNIIYKFCK